MKKLKKEKMKTNYDSSEDESSDDEEIPAKASAPKNVPAQPVTIKKTEVSEDSESDSDSKHQTRVGESALAKLEAVSDIHSEAKVHKTVKPSGAFGIRNEINKGKGNALDSTTDEEVISSLDDIRELQPILNIRKDSPSLAPLSRQGDLCFSSGLMGPDGTNRYLGRWCKRDQSKGSVAMQGSVKHLEKQIYGTTSGNDGRTETSNAKEEEFLSQIQNLQKELSFLSSCSLAKEKENLRKDLEKTKVKLKETESKLKNAVQEKTKLEGQKAFAEREVKRLHGQKTLLERDISKRDSLAGRRRDSMVDRSSKMFDSKKSKGLAASFEQIMQEDYRNLEVLAFKMEATIASLEEEVTAAHKKKGETKEQEECDSGVECNIDMQKNVI
uniref:Uncharacterized protein n=1 Tax=Salix viminalis TaxID=40686 RepID=A0A6N2LTV8_SALVM